MLNMERLKEFVEKDARKQALKRELNQLNKELNELEPELLESFAEEGVESIKVDGRIVFLHRQIWAQVVGGACNRPLAVEALKRAGLSDFVSENFNSNQLSAYMRELERNGEPLPEEFDGILEANEKFSLRTRKAR